MKLSAEGLQHLAEFEGIRLELYDDPAGHCTIGVGHLVHLGNCDGRSSEAPFRDGITLDRAYQMLGEDVASFERCVDEVVAVELQQHQFDALVSLAYNVGCGGLSSSPVLGALNAGDDPTSVWRNFALTGVGSDVKLPGLVRRREAECALYHKPHEGRDDDEDMATIIKTEESTKTYLVRGGKPKHIPTREMREELADAFGIPREPKLVSKETFDFLSE